MCVCVHVDVCVLKCVCACMFVLSCMCMCACACNCVHCLSRRNTRNYLQVCSSIANHMAREEADVFPLLARHLCATQQRVMVWRTLRAMPLRLLERVMPWVTGVCVCVRVCVCTRARVCMYASGMQRVGMRVSMCVSSVTCTAVADTLPDGACCAACIGVLCCAPMCGSSIVMWVLHSL